MLEDRRDHLARHAVASVDHDLQRPQALGVYKAQAVFCVIYGDVRLLDGTRVIRGVGESSRDERITDLTEAGISREGDGFLPAQLEAVVVSGVVRGRDHDPAGLLQVPYGEVERVCRDQPEVEYVRAGLRDPTYESPLQSLAGEAHVAGDHDPGAREIQVRNEGAADVGGHALIQALGIDAADIVGLENRLVEHLLPPGCVRPVVFSVRYNNGLWPIVQTGSQRTRGRRALGPRFVTFAALFYGSLAVVAALWCGLRGFDVSLLGASATASALLGLATAACTVALGLLAYRLLPTLREISEELAPRLVDGADATSLVLVAIFSGVGEEAFFRGALQQEFGLVLASLLFGLAHVGPDRRYFVWTAWAVLAGFVFGFLYEVSGSLLAPILAHTAHNAATLLLWKRYLKGPKKTGGL